MQKKDKRDQQISAMIHQRMIAKSVFWKNDENGAVIAVPLPRKIFNCLIMKFRLALSLILLAVITRLTLNLIPNPPYNFSPLAAIGLFGIASFKRPVLALAIPFLALFVSDLFLNNVIYAKYYTGFTLINSWWIYAAFALVVFTGWALLRQKTSPTRVVAASLISSIVFFLVTNFSVWQEGILYPLNAAGLMASYTAGLPFLGNTILGDLFFSSMLFGLYHWAGQMKFSVAKQSNAQ
jgi:hypothetical protein